MVDRLFLFALSIGMLIGVGFAHGADGTQTVQSATRLLNQGDADGALKLLREAQVDHPESAELQFGTACAFYAKATAFSESGAVEEAATAYEEARSRFSNLSTSKNIRIAEEAAFNAANVTAKQALDLAASPTNRNEAIAALRNAVSRYEAALKHFPNHSGLRQNLDHTQLKLKELLQTADEEQQEQEQEQPPQDDTPKLLSRFGQAVTELPGASVKVDGNTATLITPKSQEGES